MAAHSSILAWTEELAGYGRWGHKESVMTQQLSVSTNVQLHLIHPGGLCPVISTTPQRAGVRTFPNIQSHYP